MRIAQSLLEGRPWRRDWFGPAPARIVAIWGVLGVAFGGCSGGTTSPGTAGVMGSGGSSTGQGGTGGGQGTGGISGGGAGAAGVTGAGGSGGRTGAGGMGGGAGTPSADAGSADAGHLDAGNADAGNGGAADSRAADASPPPADAGPGGRPDAGPPAATCNLTGPAGPKTPTVWVIGDSTASLYTADLFPRMGWAQPLPDFFAPACATIQDKALSGRSSKSFFDEGAWTPIRDALRAGDTVLIQFGHNDEKSDDPTLFTDPFTTYEQYLSIYIDDSKAKGATPILLTSINRNKWSAGLLSDTHGNYPVAVRQLAAARQVSLVDMTALTKSYFERIGQAATTLLFMDLAPGQFPNYPAGNVDDTHLQEVGARLIGQMTLADLSRQKLAPGTLTKTVPQAP
jgi:lysophospholipase L1-like esterase